MCTRCGIILQQRVFFCSALFSISSGSGFALGNRIHWFCGEGSANFAAVRVAFSISSGSGFALGNRIHWPCGEASANLATAGVGFSISSGPGFALGNRIHWLSGEGSANREPVDLERTAELKNQLLLLFWRYWILTRIKERSWATVSIPVAQLLLRRGSIIPITYSSDLS